MEIEIEGNAQSEMGSLGGEPIACVMEAMLMPAAAYQAREAGTQSFGEVESLGRGVVYLYLSSKAGSEQLKGYGAGQVNRKASLDFGAAKLTATETIVLERLSEGKSNKAIASDMFVSVNTIKTHVRSIFQKLNVNCRSAAVRKAIDLGISRCSE